MEKDKNKLPCLTGKELNVSSAGGNSVAIWLGFSMKQSSGFFQPMDVINWMDEVYANDPSRWFQTKYIPALWSWTPAGLLEKIRGQIKWKKKNFFAGFSSFWQKYALPYNLEDYGNFPCSWIPTKMTCFGAIM